LSGAFSDSFSWDLFIGFVVQNLFKKFKISPKNRYNFKFLPQTNKPIEKSLNRPTEKHKVKINLKPRENFSIWQRGRKLKSQINT
jgi:hypothetical protein